MTADGMHVPHGASHGDAEVPLGPGSPPQDGPRRTAALEAEIVRRLRDGQHGIERNFVAVLARSGVEMEDPTGTPFNPDRHQAMSEQDAHSHRPGTVLQAYTPAWTLDSRLPRPAMVVVAKAPAAQASR